MPRLLWRYLCGALILASVGLGGFAIGHAIHEHRPYDLIYAPLLFALALLWYRIGRDVWDHDYYDGH